MTPGFLCQVSSLAADHASSAPLLSAHLPGQTNKTSGGRKILLVNCSKNWIPVSARDGRGGKQREEPHRSGRSTSCCTYSYGSHQGTGAIRARAVVSGDGGTCRLPQAAGRPTLAARRRKNSSPTCLLPVNAVPLGAASRLAGKISQRALVGRSSELAVSSHIRSQPHAVAGRFSQPFVCAPGAWMGLWGARRRARTGPARGCATPLAARDGYPWEQQSTQTGGGQGGWTHDVAAMRRRIHGPSARRAEKFSGMGLVLFLVVKASPAGRHMV